MSDISVLDAVASNPGFGFYNAGRRFARRILTIPARTVERIRRIDDLLNADMREGTGGLVTPVGESAQRSGVGSVALPGPWEFLTSWYFCGLMVMGFVLNRIHNIVVPPRRASGLRIHGGRRHARPHSTRQVVLNSFLPFDLTATHYRSLFRVPSLYLLLKSLLLWVIVLLQSAQLYPSWNWRWLQYLDAWVAQKSMEEICWFTFTSTCITLAVAALTNGLEGANGNGPTPFNVLFVFAYQLFLYSSPKTLTARHENYPSRPDKHVVLSMLIPLLQLTLLHGLEAKRSWSRQRLWPTTLCALLSLAHFHSVVWTSPSSYPLTNYVTCVFNSVCLGMVGVTTVLNVLTQLLLEGEVTRPLFGHADALVPHADEDFQAVIIKLGTASLHATNAAGLGNEVGSVAGGASLAVVSHEEEEGHIEVDRAGVMSMRPAYEMHMGQKRAKKGFTNEVRDVKAVGRTGGAWMDVIFSLGWRRREAWAYLMLLVSTLWALARTMWRQAVKRLVHGPSVSPEHTTEFKIAEPPVAETEADLDADEDAYDRFLRGESVSDDEDDDFQPPTGENPAYDSDIEEDEADASDGEEVPVVLYAELAQASTASAQVILAHMTSQSPLTRRRYNGLLAGRDVERDRWEQFVMERRATKAQTAAQEDPEAEARRNCAICKAEQREIICWPCRCLALCDDCRGNLASRAPASEHICPCCRQPVDGYSRIFIP